MLKKLLSVDEIKSHLRFLPEKERSIITKRFNLDGQGKITLKEVGKSLGITRERVRQIEEESLYRIHNIIQRVKNKEAA